MVNKYAQYKLMLKINIIYIHIIKYTGYIIYYIHCAVLRYFFNRLHQLYLLVSIQTNCNYCIVKIDNVGSFSFNSCNFWIFLFEALYQTKYKKAICVNQAVYSKRAHK